MRSGVPTNYVLFSIISFVPFVQHYHFRFYFNQNSACSLFPVTSHCGCLIHKDMNGHTLIVEALSLTHSVKKKKYQQKVSWDIFDLSRRNIVSFWCPLHLIVNHHPSSLECLLHQQLTLSHDIWDHNSCITL